MKISNKQREQIVNLLMKTQMTGAEVPEYLKIAEALNSPLIKGKEVWTKESLSNALVFLDRVSITGRQENKIYSEITNLFEKELNNKVK